MKAYLIVLVIFFSLWTVACKKNPVTPQPPTGFDTTSHIFAWQTFTFGGGGSSELTDVAIINDTIVYAVGSIYSPDSPAGQPYNLAVWNGKTWTLNRIMFPLCDQNGNQQSSGSYIARGIFAFSPNDIWISCDVSLVHWDGLSFNPVCMPLSYGRRNLGKMWGANSQIYLEGTNGFIAFYNSRVWTEINSETTLPINDIWGARNSAGQWEILAIASNPDSTANTLLRINSNNTVTPLSTDGLLPFATGLWFAPEKKYYVVGSGIGQKSSLNDLSWSVYPSGEVTSYASSAIYGQGLNDIFVTGSFMEVTHYNGSTWHNYKDEIPFANGALGAISLKGNTVVIVGYIDQEAVAIIGKRQ